MTPKVLEVGQIPFQVRLKKCTPLYKLFKFYSLIFLHIALEAEHTEELVRTNVVIHLMGRAEH